MMFDCIGGILCLCQNRTAGRISAGRRARNTTRHALRRSGRKCAGRMLTLSGRPAPLPERRRAHILPPALYPLLKKAPRRISSRRRKKIDIGCSRGRRSRPPALPFLVRSNSGRAAAPRALGELCPRRDRQQLARRGRGSPRAALPDRRGPGPCSLGRGPGAALGTPAPADGPRPGPGPAPGPASFPRIGLPIFPRFLPLEQHRFFPS